MTRPPRRLPPAVSPPPDHEDAPVPRRLLTSGAAPVSTVRALRAAGATAQRLRASDLAAPAWGLRAIGPGPVDRIGHLRALTDLTPGDAVVTHATAAWVWGIWLPSALDPLSPLHLSKRIDAGGRPRPRGVRPHTLPPAAPVTRLAGVPVTSAAWTWTDLATQLVPWGDPRSVPPLVEERALEDLVVAGESLLQSAHGAAAREEPGEHPRCTRAELAAVVGKRRNVRGVRLMRAALPLLRDGSGSPAESRLRLRLVGAGFPEPRMNVRVTLRGGSWIMPDLVWEESRVCLEYEGDHHRTDVAQFREDISRVRRLEASDWTCLRVAGDVWTPSGFERMAADLRAALLRRGAVLSAQTNCHESLECGPDANDS
ncbi:MULTISPECIES: hypothetical protein [Micrococcus]|uniref:hypothetical protein n=1 Tax=Micrococcus antarcticus TaxID=86171 RepID=UPI003262B95A